MARVKHSARRRTATIMLWTLAVPFVLCGLLLAALTAAGWWVERVYLREEIRFGGSEGAEGSSIRVHGARFDWWRLNVHADSVWFRSPSLDARAGVASVRLDWIDGLAALRPAARLDVDSVWLRLRADTAAREKKPLDSLAFPDFSLPLAVRVVVRGLRVDDDSSRSLGFVARARGVTVRSRGGERARARIGRVETRWTGDLAFGASASLEWSHSDSVDLRATVTRDSDFVRLEARHAKAPLWKGRDSLQAEVRDAAPYVSIFGPGSALPDAGGLRLTASAAVGDSLGFELRLEGKTGAHVVSEDFALSPQTVRLSAAWRDDEGEASLRSVGDGGEDILLEAHARRLTGTTGADSLPWSWLAAESPWERVAGTLRGHARGLRVKVRDTVRTADAVIRTAAWDGRAIGLDVLTGDSSRLAASGVLAGPPRARRATFDLTVQPDDRWVKVLLGDKVLFTAMTARGTLRNETVTATIAARGIESYGFKLDSARTSHVYSLANGVYTLKPSVLYDGKDAWTLSGTIRPPPDGAGPGRDGIDLDATLAGPGGGFLRYTLAPDGTMEALANDFEATALPYAPLDSMPLRAAVLDGSFRWNPARKTGFADLKARGRYVPDGGSSEKGEVVDAKVAGEWTPRLLTLREATVGYRGSDLTARARLRMEGRQFYQIAEVPPDGYEFAAVETGRINLADILAAFLAEPPLEKGLLRGGLAFSDTAGFAGTLVFEEIVLRDPPADLVIRELRVAGRGDSLRAFGRTESPVFPLLNDTVRVTLTGARADTQHVLIDVTADRSLRARLTGVMHRFDGLRGSLTARGSARLPEGTGSLEDLDVSMTFDVPFDAGLGGGVLNDAMLRTKTFTGAYENGDQPRQRFSLDPTLQGGVLKVSRLRIENDQGQALTGSLEYNPSQGVLNVKADGARFAAQWADDYRLDLHDLHIEYRQGPEGARARAGFSSGTFFYADPPLRVEGRLTSLRADYVRPPKPDGGAGRLNRRVPDTLRVTGVLQDSELRHRLRSLGDIQRLIRRNERRRPGVGAPLLLDINVRTLGNRNRINSDIVRLAWVGNLSMTGIHPYTLLEGRVNTLSGNFGLEGQAYEIRRLDLKWLNAPAEEGEIHMEARKSLARTCTPQSSGATDSCTVITRLDGTLEDMQFSYDSDCGGAFGAGANVAAILYSVQRGCYDASIAAGGGAGYGERALTLLEPTISRSLSNVVGRVSGSWIEFAEVTGLASLSPDGEDPNVDTLGQALSLALTSREYMRLRLKIRSGYHTASQDLSNPWEHMFAIEWRPPLPAALRDSLWRERLDNNLRVAASVQTHAVRENNLEDDKIEKKIGLMYNHVFWGSWWVRKTSVNTNEK